MPSVSTRSTLTIDVRRCLGNANLGDARRGILEAPMPRFIWLVRGVEPSGTLDILLDATGIEQMNLCFRCVAHGTDLPAWFAGMREEVIEGSRQFGCEDIAEQILGLGGTL